MGEIGWLVSKTLVWLDVNIYPLMKVSVCITTLNEVQSIKKLLKSIFLQTKKPSQVVIVDGGSTDGTINVLRSYKNRIELIESGGSSISNGRNISIKRAKFDIVAITDAGCVADRNWLKRITEPFEDETVDVVAGFYNMITKSDFQKSLSVFLGTRPDKFDNNFLPSARSIAFRKSIWEKVGGFNEKLSNAAEDTEFNYKLALQQAQIVRVKSAIVEWGIPTNIFNAYRKFFIYSRGDAETKIFWNPVQKFKSHNIKVLLIFPRYILLLALFGLSLGNNFYFPIFLAFSIAYLFWAYKKAGFWGIVIQVISDIAVMSGFISGILGV